MWEIEECYDDENMFQTQAEGLAVELVENYGETVGSAYD